MKEKSWKGGKIILCAALALSMLVTLMSLPNMIVYADTGGLTGPYIVGNNGSLDGTNTSRNLAFDQNGNAYVVYRDTIDNSCKIKKSTDGGKTWGEAVTICEVASYEPEVTTADNGNVYVSYRSGNSVYVAYSTDGGKSFTSALVELQSGDANRSMHIACDNNYVYAVSTTGIYCYVSTDGGASFTPYITCEGTSSYAFSDVKVDTTTGTVIIIKDKPDVVYYVSTDHGKTFTDTKIPMVNGQQAYVYYSTAAYGASHFYMAGNQAALGALELKSHEGCEHSAYTHYYISDVYPSGEWAQVTIIVFNEETAKWEISSTDEINLAGLPEGTTTGSVLYRNGDNYYACEATLEIGEAMYKVNTSTNETTKIIIPCTVGANSRSLAADNSGNLMVGYVKANGKVAFKVSNDYGATFGEEVEVATASEANVFIDPTTGNMSFLYTDSSGNIYIMIAEGYIPPENPIDVTGVSLNKNETTLEIGATETLEAAIEPANATNKNVSWSSNNTTVATVDEDGKVTAMASGTATITVTTTDGGKTATCVVSVNSGTTHHTHSYTKDIATANFLKSAATCTSKAVYYKSCECGEKGTDTFEAGEKLDHDFSGKYKVTKEASATEEGKMETTCKYGCGTKNIVTIPMKTTETINKSANAIALNAGLKVSQTNKALTVKWGEVAGADGYLVYATYCGSEYPTKAVTTTKKTSVTITKLNGKKLDLKKNYKVYVKAYKVVDGKPVVLGKSIVAHVVGRNSVNYTNAKSIKLTSKSSITMKNGKTSKIKASVVLVNQKKSPLSDKHAATFRYATTNKKVATVSADGKITAVGKGNCYVYVYAKNGYAKKIKVTVK